MYVFPLLLWSNFGLFCAGAVFLHRNGAVLHAMCSAGSHSLSVGGPRDPGPRDQGPRAKGPGAQGTVVPVGYGEGRGGEGLGGAWAPWTRH